MRLQNGEPHYRYYFAKYQEIRRRRVRWTVHVAHKGEDTVWRQKPEVLEYL